MTFQVKNKKLKEKKESFSIKNEIPSKEIYINKHNWSFELKGKKAKVSLGNLSDAGWFWDGNEKDLIGFSYRLHNLRVDDEFYETMEQENVSFDKLKSLFLKSAETSDGLYEISGDNLRWHFGETNTEDEYIIDEEELTEEQKNKFYEEYSPITYEEFAKSYKKEYKEDVKKAINSSHSFKEFNEKLKELSEDYTEKVVDENTQRAYKTIKQIKK